VKIVVLHDGGSDEWSSADVAAVLGNIREIQQVLRKAGHEAEAVPVYLADLTWLDRCQRADLVFNLCEGINGHSRFEDYVVAALELARVPFTGCRSWPVTICHRKHVANTLLQAAGVPVPRFALVHEAVLPEGLRYPVIVKPSMEDASVGIDEGSVCRTPEALVERLTRVTTMWEDVLVQEYVAGREFNIGFVGRTALPISEIDFTGLGEGKPPIVTFAAKWTPGSDYDLHTVPVCPARVDAATAARLVAVAEQAWRALAKCEGYGRVDIRLDAAGTPWVLEVNPDPDLSSDAGLARMGRAYGWDYQSLVMHVVEEALDRGRIALAEGALAGRVTS
jgi:D-alanine-D-alanine ligase